MKIVYCITSSNWGGAQKYVFELICYEIKRKNKVTLVVGKCGELTDRLNGYNVEIIVLPNLIRDVHFIKDFKAFLGLRKVLKKINPDIVHLNSSKAGTIGRLSSYGLKCHVIFTAHGWAFTEGVSRARQIIFSAIERCMAPLTDAIICVSKYDYDLAIKKHVLHINGNGYIIYNGSSINTNNRVESRSQRKIKMTMIARFDDQKNQMLLLEALKQIKFEYEMNFVGDGKNLNEIKKYTVQNEKYFKNNIVFSGFKRDAQQMLQDTDIFVLISNYEGLPISIIEAMSFGLPIIASDVGGVNELVDRKNGILVNSKQEIINGVTKLAKDYNLRKSMGMKSREEYQKKFTLTAMLNKTNQLYESIIFKDKKRK